MIGPEGATAAEASVVVCAAGAAVWVVATSATASTFTSASTAASLALSRPRLREMLRERAGFAAVSGFGSARALLTGRATEISGVSPRGMGALISDSMAVRYFSSLGVAIV